MRKAIVACLFMIVTLFQHGDVCAESTTGASVVAKIIDGETLELKDGTEVRLIGVSARDQSSGTTKAESFGRGAYLSKKFMAAAIQGKSVILSHDPAFARYKHRDNEGRVWAYVRYSVYFQSKNKGGGGSKYSATAVKKVLNAEIIKQGYGFVDRRNSYRERDSYIMYEEEAREKQRGVWRPQLQFYDKMLERGKGARSGSVSKYIEKGTRRLSLESARKTFDELIQLVPKDYRAYYERSWLGADSLNNKVTERNLEDINQAVELSASNPKCYAQKHFILRLLGRHAEAVLAYEEAVKLASKYGMAASVSYFTDQERESGQLADPYGGKEVVGLAADAFRASMNRDHFLIFMARYRSLQRSGGQEVEALFKKMLENPVFKAFHDTHQEILKKAKTPQDILYETKWAMQGWDDPEDVLTAMEKAVV